MDEKDHKAISLDETAIVADADITAIHDDLKGVQRDLKEFQGTLRDLLEDNEELRAECLKCCKEFDSFRSSTNFRLSLYQSKEIQNVKAFFAKFLAPDAVLPENNEAVAMA